MKKIKLIIWIVVLMLLESFGYARIFGAVPALTFAFLVCVALNDDNFYTAAVTGGVCGMLAGSLLGRSFSFIFIFYTLSAAAVYTFRKKPRYTHAVFKAVFWCGLLTAVMELVLFALETRSISLFALYSIALPSVLYNIAAVLVIYPLIMKTVYNEEKQRKLIT